MMHTLTKIACLALVLVFSVGQSMAIAMPCVCASVLDCPHCKEKPRPVQPQHHSGNSASGDCCPAPVNSACEAETKHPINAGDLISRSHSGEGGQFSVDLFMGSAPDAANGFSPNSYRIESITHVLLKVPIYLQNKHLMC